MRSFIPKPVLALLAGGLLLCTACDTGSEESDEGAAAAAAPSETTAAPAAPPPEEVYEYNPVGKRDPFRSFLTQREEEAEAARTPLQRFELEQFKFVGIVWGLEDPVAMVEDPEANSHVIEVGTYIGKNWGKVTRITSDAVEVTEEYTRLGGELVTERRELRLHPVEDTL